MTLTATTILADFVEDMTAYEESTPRARQVQIGASQIYGCIAENIYRLRGADGERRLSWQAVVGKAIHGHVEQARTAVRPGAIAEERFVFRDVTATIDYLDPAQHLLIDVKTKDDADAIDGIEARPEWIAQVQLGAAAAREAGYIVEHVAVLVLPRDGDLSDAVVLGPWDYDEQQAIDAAKWAATVQDLADDPAVDPRDHQGKPFFFCKAYCPFVAECRGEPAEEVILADLAAPALRYYDAKSTRDEAEAQMKTLRPLLLGFTGRAGDIVISTSAGSAKSVEVEDVEAMRELARFINGSVPITTTEKVVSPRLTVKRVTA